MSGTAVLRILAAILLLWMPGRAESRADELRPEDTIDTLQQAIDSGQAEAADYVRLGHACLAAGKVKRARKAFQKAVNLGLKAEGYNGIGLVYWQAKKYRRQALPYFRRALHANPSFVDAQYNLAVAYQALRPMDALKAFERVLEIDPDHRDAHYRVGRLLEAQGAPDRAIDAYQKQVRAHPAHTRAKYRLSKLLLSQGRWRKAVRVFGELMTTGGEVEAWAYREMAVLNQLTGRFEEAQWLFEAYIDRLPGAERELYRDISLVATREELARYRNAPEGQKEDLRRRFWNRHDPAPLTRANERLVEHYRRVAFARERYGAGDFPWDVRGEVYVRLGHPDHVSRSENIRAERDADVRDARLNFSNRLRATLSRAPGLKSPELDLPVTSPGLPAIPVEKGRWEYWVYADLDNGTEFTFVDEFSGGRYNFAPAPRGLPPALAVELLTFHGEVILRNLTAGKPSVYRPRFATLPVDFSAYTAAYRGAEGATRLELYLGLPASEAARLKTGEGDGLIVLDRGLAVYDSLWNEVHRLRDQVAFRAPTDRQVLDRAFIPGVLPVDLPPGAYHLALQIRNAASGRSRVYARDVVLQDYSGRDGLQISDIELALMVHPAEGQDSFVKGDLRVVPMPSRTYRAGQHAFVYFEIYNLHRDEFGRTRYRVDYTLRSHKKRAVPGKILHGLGRALRLAKKDREIVIAYDQVGDRAEEAAYVELDLTEAEPGGQVVRVTVTDLLTQRQASKEIELDILP